MSAPFTQVVVIDTQTGDKIADNASGSIEHTTFFTIVQVPVRIHANAGSTYLITGYEGNPPHGKMLTLPGMHYNGGDKSNSKFIDDLQ